MIKPQQNQKKYLRKNIKTSVKFHRPRTKKVKKSPKYSKKLVGLNNEKNYLTFFKSPVTTESSMKKIQSSNTIILMFDVRSTKKNIKILMEKIYKTKVTRINTLITPQGYKKAFVKLSPNHDALDIANKIGFI